jgi:ribosome-binding ATPase YchF (GTP1/OBG family)
VQVVRCFSSDEIIHVEGGPNPERDIDIINTELLLKDLDTVEKRFHRAEADARSGKKDLIFVRDVLKKIKTELEKGIPLFASSEYSSFSADGKNIEIIGELGLLTAKAQIFLLNGNEDDVSDVVKEKIKSMHAGYVIANLGSGNPIPELIRSAYTILNLVSFLTTGEDETRAWTIKRGAKAPEAAGAIHTDFEKKFIRAEVIFWEKLVQAGGWNQAKQKGWLRLEGKDYVVQDGDVMVIRHG